MRYSFLLLVSVQALFSANCLGAGGVCPQVIADAKYFSSTLARRSKKPLVIDLEMGGGQPGLLRPRLIENSVEQSDDDDGVRLIENDITEVALSNDRTIVAYGFQSVGNELAFIQLEVESESPILIQFGQSPYRDPGGRSYALTNTPVFYLQNKNVWSIAISPDRSFLVATTKDGEGVIYDLVTKQVMREFKSAAGSVADFSPDGTHIILTDRRGSLSILRGFRSLGAAHKFEMVDLITYNDNTQKLLRWSISNDSKTLVVKGRAKFHVYDWPSLSPKEEIPFENATKGQKGIQILEFLLIGSGPSTKIVAIASSASNNGRTSGTTDVFAIDLSGRVESLHSVDWFNPIKQGFVTELAYGKRERAIQAIGEFVGGDPQWDESLQVRSQTAMASTPDGKFLVTGDVTGRLNIFDLRKSAALVISVENPMRAVFSSRAKRNRFYFTSSYTDMTAVKSLRFEPGDPGALYLTYGYGEEFRFDYQGLVADYLSE